MQELCYALTSDRGASLSIAKRMDEWKRQRKGRRLVDYRFKDDQALCSSVLQVCSKSGNAVGGDAGGNDDDDDDDDDDDEREL